MAPGENEFETPALQHSSQRLSVLRRLVSHPQGSIDLPPLIWSGVKVYVYSRAELCVMP